MKTAWKSEIKDFAITGVKNQEIDGKGKVPCVSLSFQAYAKGRLVAWNKITGNTLVSLARLSAKGFGPQDISSRDFAWVVHIVRGGKPVVRAMKATPRKEAINNALCQLLAPALLGADTDPDRPFVNEKDPDPKVARKRTRKPKAEQPESGDDLLKIPPFLKRDPGEKQPAAAQS